MGTWLENFDRLLRDATSSIGERYVRLPIALGGNTYRERVYCYELYHQMRRLWPDASEYSLNGEVDKGGHPFLEDREHLHKVIPDLLVHVPGTMDRNFAVIEVKPANAKMKGILKDVQTLSAFLADWGYRRGILLFYGAQGEGLLRKLQKGLLDEDTAEIEIWHHAQIGRPAELLGRLAQRD